MSQIIIYYVSYLEPMITIGFNLIMTMIYVGSLLIWVMNSERRLKAKCVVIWEQRIGITT